jgi:hypothetical protein
VGNILLLPSLTLADIPFVAWNVGLKILNILPAKDVEKFLMLEKIPKENFVLKFAEGRPLLILVFPVVKILE